MKINIKDELKKHYQTIPLAPNPDGMKQAVLQMRMAMPALEEVSLPYWQFILSQFHFIRKKVWAAQIFALLACGLALFYLPEGTKTIAILSAATPLIMLTNVFELSRSYTYRTAEIELSTQYSLKQVMIARLTVLGMVDVLCLTILLILSGIQLPTEIYAVILYIVVPFLATCFGCLLILNRVKSKECNYYCVALGLCITVAIGVATVQYPKMYEHAAIGVWAMVFVVTFIGMLHEVNRMLKNCVQGLDMAELNR